MMLHVQHFLISTERRCSCNISSCSSGFVSPKLAARFLLRLVSCFLLTMNNFLVTKRETAPSLCAYICLSVIEVLWYYWNTIKIGKQFNQFDKTCRIQTTQPQKTKPNVK